MRVAVFVALALLTVACSRQETTVTAQSEPTPNVDAGTHQSAVTMPTIEAAEKQHGGLKSLSADEQEQLLSSRLDGGMDGEFSQFANMFLAMSRISLEYGVGLMTNSQEIGQTTLQSPFPRFYEPTLREFLDAIALQTFSEWKYDPTEKYFEIKGKHDAPFEGLAIFEFKPREMKRERPFEVTLADGWKVIDKGNWAMFVPPSFPVGMDIYEMGSYSSDGEVNESEFLKSVRREVALEWAQRVRNVANLEDLKPGKVGAHDALFFESMVPSQLGKELRWRHWVFIAENQCYFVVSTILPELDKNIFPDVEKMLSSFKLKK